MTSFEIYVFALCFIVFAVLTLLFSYMIWLIARMSMKMIQLGASDQEITKEYEKEKNASPVMIWVERIASLLLCLVFAAAFLFSTWMNITEQRPANGIPSIKVVQSESMATKHKDNTYLEENDLQDQLQIFDIVVCFHMPAEEDVELYDVVVYQKGDYYLIHRIVGIEEPNENHPNERYFLLKGDANKYVDEFPVLYSQMKGIYTGVRIPFIGSFVLFMQSPAGWLVLLLVVFAMVGTPLVENKWKKARTERLIEIGVIIPEPEEPAAEMETENSEHEAEEAGEPESDQIEAETSEQTGVRL